MLLLDIAQVLLQWYLCRLIITLHQILTSLQPSRSCNLLLMIYQLGAIIQQSCGCRSNETFIIPALGWRHCRLFIALILTATHLHMLLDFSRSLGSARDCLLR